MCVYVRRPPSSSQTHGSCTRFICRFKGPYIVISHVHGRPDLLRLRHESDNTELSTVNIEKLVVVPSGDSQDLCEQDPLPTKAPVSSHAGNDQELAMVCYEISKYLYQKPINSCVRNLQVHLKLITLCKGRHCQMGKTSWSFAKVPIFAFGQGYSIQPETYNLKCASSS